MELGLMLGTAPVPEKGGRGSAVLLAMRLGVGCGDEEDGEGGGHEEEEPPPSPSLQLNLLTLSQPRQPSPSRVWLPWATENRNFFDASMRGFDVNRAPPFESAEEGTSPSSSPNSTISSFRIDFSAQRCGGESRQRGGGASAAAADVESLRLDDEDDNGLARKKLRLSKDQSAFLEESFKQHNTINPKQKLALAKQLNLRPRQVEVWFQNRRARTKLKQTEVQCEYLKRCCQTLTEENRRLKKEVAELRALKTCSPFSANFPAATTLSMCASCERVASNSTDADHRLNNSTTLFSRLLPFASGPQAASAAPRQASQPTDSRNRRAPALAGH